MKLREIKIRLPKQIQSVELLRGIASSMVCYYHLARGNTNFLPDDSTVKRMATWGWSGVEIFFVISGFVIPYAMFQKKYVLRNFFTFLKKRIIRIEPPYLISIVLVIFLGFISTLSPYYRGASFHINWPNLFGHIAYLNVFTGEKWLNDVYWSLAIEFQYYLLIAISYGLIVSKRLYLRQGFLLLFLLSSFWLKSLSFVFVYAAFFISGILLFQLVCQLIPFIEFVISMICVIGVLEFQQGIVLSSLALCT
ncbi:MAG TPA: acyltransferase, partial [Puia sp.]|nr:acyltransferase [Puia sp.]